MSAFNVKQQKQKLGFCVKRERRPMGEMGLPSHFLPPWRAKRRSGPRREFSYPGGRSFTSTCNVFNIYFTFVCVRQRETETKRLCHTYMRAHGGQRKCLIPRPSVASGCELLPSADAGNQTQVPLKEQQALVTTELFLQPQLLILKYDLIVP